MEQYEPVIQRLGEPLNLLAVGRDLPVQKIELRQMLGNQEPMVLAHAPLEGLLQLRQFVPQPSGEKVFSWVGSNRSATKAARLFRQLRPVMFVATLLNLLFAVSRTW